MAVSKVTAPGFVARKRCKGAHKLSSPCAPARTERYLLSSGHFPDRCVFYAGETAQTAQAIVGILLWAPASTPQALRVPARSELGFGALLVAFSTVIHPCIIFPLSFLNR